MKTALSTKEIKVDREDDQYEPFLKSIRDHFTAFTPHDTPLFTTDAVNLFEAFLKCLPSSARQHYTCNACRHFIEKYGGLVVISPDGVTLPAVWPLEVEVPNFFKKAVRTLRRLVQRANVTGVFLSSEKVLGEPVTGVWHHMYVRQRAANVYQSVTLNASQRIAEKLEEYKMLCAGLVDFPAEIVGQAKMLLKSEVLYRSEKVLGVAEWLFELHNELVHASSSTHHVNMVWRAVATSSAGFCHVRSTMIGTLLNDLSRGVPLDIAGRSFAAKMNPLQYQRPQAAPKEGNILQAEKLVAKLELEGALERRFARVEELEAIWRPRH